MKLLSADEAAKTVPSTLRIVLSFALALALVGAAGCSSDSGESEKTNAPADAAPSSKIEAVPGMSYYVGGPVMSPDKYGRMRLARFNGEVKNPTSRGLLVGYKQTEDGKFDFRTWLNGRLVSESVGFTDEDGLLWYTERKSFDSAGTLVARQTFKYDDEAKIMQSTIEHIDTDDGSVLETVVADIPYTPEVDPEDEDLLDEE